LPNKKYFNLKYSSIFLDENWDTIENYANKDEMFSIKNNNHKKIEDGEEDPEFNVISNDLNIYFKIV
jgi:hypothetical protein